MGVTAADAEATIATAIELGIRVFDTAYSYGLDGEADRYLAAAIRGESDRFHVISKVGQRYLPDGERVVDQLREIAQETGRSVADLAVSWALSQPGVTAALVGARRPDQIREVATAGPLDAHTLGRMNAAIEDVR